MMCDKRYRRMHMVVFVLALVGFFASACVAAPERPSRTTSITKGVAFLKRNYNPDIGLIRESPETAPNRYWLATDNWLAVRALRAAGEHKLADRIQASIAEYNTSDSGILHGVIEVLEGVNIEWPPSTPKQCHVKGQVWIERRNTDEIMQDWREYSDLALYGVLDAYHEGDHATARDRYSQAMKDFATVGFEDKAFDGHYTTYKVALALYVADVMGVSPEPAFMDILLSIQTADGGFTALYDKNGTPVGDANTETTSLAILALSRYVP